MPVQDALRFIEQLRTDEALQHQVAGLKCSAHLDSLVELGAQVGLMFTADELEAAHRHDWGMRWLMMNSAHEQSGLKNHGQRF